MKVRSSLLVVGGLAAGMIWSGGARLSASGQAKEKEAPVKRDAIRAGRLIDGKTDTAIANALILIEGDKIVGETPRLAPGEEFSYNSRHVESGNSRAFGSYHGVDDLGRKVHVLLPPFDMVVPER